MNTFFNYGKTRIHVWDTRADGIELDQNIYKEHANIMYIFTLQSVSDVERNTIINKHNDLRSNPQTTQTAKAMCKVVGGEKMEECLYLSAITLLGTFSQKHLKFQS